MPHNAKQMACFDCYGFVTDIVSPVFEDARGKVRTKSNRRSVSAATVSGDPQGQPRPPGVVESRGPGPEPGLLEARGWLFDHSRDQILHMLQVMNARATARPGRAVVFLAPGPGAGTTSLAWGYARAAAALMSRRVLILDASCTPAATPLTPETPIVTDALVAGPCLAVKPRSGETNAAMNVYVSRLNSEDQQGRDVLATVSGPAFWQEIRAPFDEVVIDCPAASRSPVGMAMAPHADAVVLVVEADRTRAPVAEKLLRELRAMDANVVGAVLNRRRHYVPARIYDRL